MQLREAIAAAGMTPPESLAPGRWIRFPGAGKGRRNRAGWCRVISPTLAIFGDFSTGLREKWKDEAHRDDATSRRLLAEARERERQFERRKRQRAKEVEIEARQLLARAAHGPHPYLTAKGFPEAEGLVYEGKLLVPIHAVEDYRRITSMQLVGPDGEKRFLPGGRVRGGMHIIGSPHAKRIALCEGYATGLSVKAALDLLPGPWGVLVTFSAQNLVAIARWFPQAIVAADNDASGVGEAAARETGLPWRMPPVVGRDFNDQHSGTLLGLRGVMEILRDVI